jgi:hypothetical protein
VNQPVEGVPVEGVAARTDRVAQGAVGIALLAAFVFRIPLVIPVLALILAIGAVGGPQANALHLVFERWIAPRLPAGMYTNVEPRIPAPTVRAQDALETAVLLVAGVAFAIGISLLGWILVIAEAVIAILAATTRIHVADRVRRSIGR